MGRPKRVRHVSPAHRWPTITPLRPYKNPTRSKPYPQFTSLLSPSLLPPFSNLSPLDLCSPCPAPTTTPTDPAMTRTSWPSASHCSGRRWTRAAAPDLLHRMSPAAAALTPELALPTSCAAPRGQLASRRPSVDLLPLQRWVLVPAPPAPHTRTPESEARAARRKRQWARERAVATDAVAQSYCRRRGLPAVPDEEERLLAWFYRRSLTTVEADARRLCRKNAKALRRWSSPRARRRRQREWLS